MFFTPAQVLNWFGLLFGLQSVVFLGVIWYIGISLTEQVCSRTGWDEDRKFHDRLGKWWSWANLALGGCSPAIFGQDNLPAEGTGALFVSNHASWFDIPLVAQVRRARGAARRAARPPRARARRRRRAPPRSARFALFPAPPSAPYPPPPPLQAIPNTYKFVAADELRAVPIVSQQLIDGKHILIDRSTRKGQLKSFKESVNYLKKGVGVFAFPEGTRSRSGRMMPFKGGVFAMATKAGVPIVPITVCGTYYTYPSQAILPLRPNPVDDNWLHAALLEQGIVPAGAAEEALEVHIHPQISSDGRTEAELEELTRAAILSKLPKVNHPLEA